MKKMKKFLSLSVAAVLALSMTACGSKAGDTQTLTLQRKVHPTLQRKVHPTQSTPLASVSSYSMRH